MSKSDKLISCVVPAYNESAHIVNFLEDLTKHLHGTGYRYEIIVVDDGSADDTVARIMEKFSESEYIKLIEFTRNFGKESALTAGLNHVNGHATILIDSDYQHPFATIDDFIAKWEEGYDMVYGVRTNRQNESWLKKRSADLFYKFLSNIGGVDIPRNAGDFRLMDEKVVDAIRMMPERSRFMKGLYAWVGYKSIPVPFEVKDRLSGQSGWGYHKLAILALTGITSFTDLPLKLVGLLGLLIAFLSFCYGFFIIVDYLIFGNPTPGFATTIVIVTFLGGVQLFSIGVVGEYIAGIFREVKQRPNYLIQNKYGFTASETDKS